MQCRLFISTLVVFNIGSFTTTSGQQDRRIQILGNVVDDETGAPIERFVIEAGKFEPKSKVDEKDVQWGYSIRRRSSPNPEGKFSTSIRWSQGWTARISANGYLPKPLLLEEPPQDQGRLQLVVRLKPGRRIAGVVVDHTGQPVSNARIYPVGRSVELGEDERREASFFALAGEKGEFEMPVGEAQSLAVSCETCEAWAFELPEDAKQVKITLPKPPLLKITYDIDGANEDGQVFYQLLTHKMKGFKKIQLDRTIPIKNGTTLTLKSLAPGSYQFCRYRMLRQGSTGRGAMIDRIFLELRPGEEHHLEFKREAGSKIFGRIKLPKEGLYSGIIVSINSVAKTKEPGTNFEYTKTLDARLAGKYDEKRMLVGDTATFVSEILPPGDYEVEANAYKPLDEKRMFRSGIIGPDSIAKERVSIPPGGQPVKVEFKMGK